MLLLSHLVGKLKMEVRQHVEQSAGKRSSHLVSSEQVLELLPNHICLLLL